MKYFKQNTLKVHNFNTGQKLYDLPLDIGTIAEVGGKRNHTKLFYKFVSFATPGTIYQVDFVGGNKTEQKVRKIFFCPPMNHLHFIDKNFKFCLTRTDIKTL